jgi:DNA polymerase IV (archaeal DinB-like DNA polymerase)
LNSIEKRAIIAIDLDYFYAQCEEVRNHCLKVRPVVVCVYSGRTQDSGAVSTCNYIARKLGVKSGMPIAFAKRILKGNDQAVFLPLDMEYYQSISEKIMEIARTSSEKFEQSSIDEAFLDVSSRFDPKLEGASSVARSVKQEILLAESLTCSVGVAENKLLAKMAVDSKKPDGFTVIIPSEEKSFLYPLPVGKLFGVGPKTEAKLKSIQVETLGDLALTDQKRLEEIFGKNLGRILREWANGIDNSPVEEKPTEQLSRIVTLKRDATSFDFCEVLEPLSADLENKLRTSKISGKTVGIIAITAQLKIKSRARTLSVPTQSGSQILAIAAELFSSFFEESAEDGQELRIRRAGIKVSELIPETTTTPQTLEQFF